MSDVNQVEFHVMHFCAKYLREEKVRSKSLSQFHTEDIYPPSTISNWSFINILKEHHSKCPKSHISQWSHIPILFDLKADFNLHPPEAAKLEAKERRRGRGEQIFLISLKVFSSGLHTVPLAIVDSFSRRGLAHLWALSWLFTSEVDCSPRRWIGFTGYPHLPLRQPDYCVIRLSLKSAKLPKCFVWVRDFLVTKCLYYQMVYKLAVD